MLNHFAPFGFEPRPWIDAELLKQRFLELSAERHPDKAVPAEKAEFEKEFQQLNESYQIIRSTRVRLLHLLELSGLPKQEHVQNVPPDALEFFAQVAAVTKDADNLIKEKAAASSPMLKVQLMERALDQATAIQSLQEELRGRIGAIEDRLRMLSADWTEPASVAALNTIKESAAALGFLERWTAQLQERVGALTF
jgi:DnaJ-domain-containing protein 1